MVYMNKSTSVIIVEDEPIIASDLAAQLEKAGLTVIETFDEGKEVLNFLDTEQPDVILMDVQLYGDLDGIDGLVLPTGVEQRVGEA